MTQPGTIVVSVVMGGAGLTLTSINFILLKYKPEH